MKSDGDNEDMLVLILKISAISANKGKSLLIPTKTIAPFLHFRNEHFST